MKERTEVVDEAKPPIAGEPNPELPKVAGDDVPLLRAGVLLLLIM